MKLAAPVFAAAICLLAFTANQTQVRAQAPAAPVLTTKTVKPGLYMIVGAGGNVAVRVTPSGVVVIDTKNSGPDIFDALLAQIRMVSGGVPIRFVVDTHHHADHTGNNGRFIGLGIPVVAQEGIKPGLDAYRTAAATPETAALVDPTRFYKATASLELGAAKVDLFHYSPGHTRGDTLVYFPDLKAVATGDEVAIPTPTFDFPGGGDIEGWENSLDQLLKLDWDVAIPGHGDSPISRADVVAFRGKLATFLARAKEQVKKGVPKDKLIAAIKVDDLGWKFAPTFWTTANRVDGLYAEASK